MTTPYTTRIAPSPTGDFHIGTARTAYFNWLAARATGGRFILRIDDTDAARNDPASIKVIHDCLDWLGLPSDQIVRQSGRRVRYAAVADDLLARGVAVRADNGAILLKDGVASAWHDLVGGDMIPGPKAQDLARSQVLLRADGAPVYHFASVVDDIDLGVNLVIRGADDPESTDPDARGLYDALGASEKRYVVIGNGSHFLFGERQGWQLYDEIERFLLPLR